MTTNVEWNGQELDLEGHWPVGYPNCWYYSGHENDEHPAVTLYLGIGGVLWTLCQECVDKYVPQGSIDLVQELDLNIYLPS